MRWHRKGNLRARSLDCSRHRLPLLCQLHSKGSPRPRLPHTLTLPGHRWLWRPRKKTASHATRWELLSYKGLCTHAGAPGPSQPLSFPLPCHKALRNCFWWAGRDTPVQIQQLSCTHLQQPIMLGMTTGHPAHHLRAGTSLNPLGVPSVWFKMY